MKRYVRLKSSWRPSSRFRICAWIETSSAETGSSQMISFGAQRERTGDADPLALAARELVRVAVVVLRVQADAVHELLDAPLGGSRLRALDRVGRADDLPDRLARVQRRVRVLEDHLHLAAERPHLARLNPVMSSPSKMTVPEVESMSFVTSRAVVDLPHPDSPTRPSVSPG